MYQPTEYDKVDKKIHKFLSKKALWKITSKMLSGYTAPRSKQSDGDIAYEELDWHYGKMNSRSSWQKVH